LILEKPGTATAYITRVLVGLEGMVSIAFAGDREAYADVVVPRLAAIADPVLRDIAASGRSIVAAAGILVISEDFLAAWLGSGMTATRPSGPS
jgi:hypothetical protein